MNTNGRRPFMLALGLLAALGCASEPRGKPIDSGADKQVKVPPPSPLSAEARATTEEVLAHGGELDLTQLPASTIKREIGEVVAWGLAEVPGDSRLQAALALADANARAELTSAVRVGIATTFQASSSETTSPGAATVSQTDVTERTVQVSNGILPALAPAQHGWKKVRRNGEEVLLVCARLTAREDALISALVAALKDKPNPGEQARAILETLGTGRRLGAQ